MTSTQPRVTPGVPEGGRWRPFENAESDVSLTEPSLTVHVIAERHRELLAANSFLPAVAHRAIDRPQYAGNRAEWWDTHFVGAEYGREGGDYAQMPDDFTPSRGGGRSISGHRRTHRMAYKGSGVTLRMPSATSVKAFERESGGQTFDIPVSADTPEGTVSGWVRVTRSGDTWSAEAMGFGDKTDPYVSESVSAVLEARRPTQALRQVGNFLSRRQARKNAHGVDTQEIPSTWISAVGYDDSSGTMVMDTTAGRSYGYAVPRSTFDKVIESNSPGSAYNKLVKGSHRVEVSKCSQCGRFAAAESGHVCPISQRPAPSSVPVHNQAARDRAMAASARLVAEAPAAPAVVPAATSKRTQSGSALSEAPAVAPVAAPAKAPAPPAPTMKAKGHVIARDNRNIDLKAKLTQWRDAPKDDGPGLYGERGWTVDAAGGALAHLTDSTHIPHLYRVNPEYMDKPLGENGDVGIVRFAGAGAEEADMLLRSVPHPAREERRGKGPTLRGVAAAARRSPGKVEFGGAIHGPDYSDERITPDVVYLFDDSENKAQAAVRARRMGVDFEQVPSSCERVPVPWRPGESAWRMIWD